MRRGKEIHTCIHSNADLDSRVSSSGRYTLEKEKEKWDKERERRRKKERTQRGVGRGEWGKTRKNCPDEVETSGVHRRVRLA